jgi:hypothetical protein
MKQEELIQEAGDLIARDLEMELNEGENLSEEALLQVVANRVAYLIEYNLEMLFSSLYRLDVSEGKVHAALMPGNPEPANIAVARLILERQKQRIRTKHQYKQDDLEGWDRF